MESPEATHLKELSDYVLKIGKEERAREKESCIDYRTSSVVYGRYTWLLTKQSYSTT